MTTLRITKFGRELIAPTEGVRVNVAVKLDVAAMRREMSAEQIAAVMTGIGQCLSVSPEPLRRRLTRARGRLRNDDVGMGRALGR